MASSSSMIIEYSKSTQNVCICLAISLFLIIIFIMTPLNTFFLSSIFGKVIILILLGYTIYYNTISTNKFTNDFNISLTSGDWDVLKTNILCSYVFSVFLIVLMLSVIRQIF
jgi:hypothetical protein